MVTGSDTTCSSTVFIVWRLRTLHGVWTIEVEQFTSPQTDDDVIRETGDNVDNIGEFIHEI